MRQWRASIDVPATSRGPAAARRVLSALLPVWGLAELRDDAELVVSELVTNAYLHAPGPDSFEMELLRQAHGIRISLADSAAARPVVAQPRDEDPTGRGLAIVSRLATDWGAEEHPGGKRVWVDVPLRAAA